ncbi:MAG: phospholipid carrier-dependent glycosyltransferase [Actinobacteria bacterium]|nr:phospholipid carrier-dependent glycosyltransferase [Actinomycetota bacterium]
MAARALPALATFARRHWLFALLLAAGGALRVVTFFAYRPALIYYDSTPYLENAEQLEPYPVRPIGYPLFLRLLPLENELAVVPFVQHLFGLLIAVVLYTLLARLGVRRWLAALATAPVLLDGYQLNIEQYILSEALFDLLLVGAIALLLWQPRPGLVPAAAAGLALSAAVLVRAGALFVIVPAVLAVLFLRARPSRAVALIGLFALPLAAYAVWFHSFHGTYGITGYGGRFLYARVAPFADCSKFEVPRHERVLCPRQPVGRRPTIEQFMWSRELSPVYRMKPPAGKTRSQVAGAFAKRVILHQPLEYGQRVASDFAHAFAPTHSRRAQDLPVARWQFQLHYPTFRANTHEVIRAHGDERGQVQPRLARFLRDYQRYGYTPGPLLAAALLAALAAALGLGRARRSGLRSASFLFAAVAVAVLLPTVAVNQFTWRYQLPLLVLLPAAGALGVTALTRRTPADRSDGAAPPAGDGPARADRRTQVERAAVANPVHR